MKDYKEPAPRLVTWRDMNAAAQQRDKATRDQLAFFSRMHKKKRRLVLSIWRQSIQSVKESTEAGSEERRAADKLARDNRDEFNDRALLAAIKIVMNDEYTTAQEHRAQDLRALAEKKKAQYYAHSCKQKILRQYELLEKLYRKYSSWRVVLQLIQKRPPKGDADPFRELRGESLTAHYISNIVAAESMLRNG